jgi:hypothetical protein
LLEGLPKRDNDKKKGWPEFNYGGDYIDGGMDDGKKWMRTSSFIRKGLSCKSS